MLYPAHLPVKRLDGVRAWAYGAVLTQSLTWEGPSEAHRQFEREGRPIVAPLVAVFLVLFAVVRGWGMVSDWLGGD